MHHRSYLHQVVHRDHQIFQSHRFDRIVPHLGEEKLQIRSTGRVKILTRQPPRHSLHGG